MVTNNSINLKDQGTTYYNGTGTFSGVDASTAGFILTSNGTGIAPSFQAASSGGTFVKQVRAITNTATTPSAAIPLDDTIPQIGEGTQLFSLAITPANSANILVFQATVQYVVDSGSSFMVAMFQDATSNATCSISGAGVTLLGTEMFTAVLTYSMTAGTTSSTTFQIRIGPNAGNAYINRTVTSATPLGSGQINSTFTISEYSA